VGRNAKELVAHGRDITAARLKRAIGMLGLAGRSGL